MIRPGFWHTVRISRTGRKAWLYVDDQPPVEGLTPGGFTMLSLAQPLFLGAIPAPNYPAPTVTITKNFIGCIQKVS